MKKVLGTISAVAFVASLVASSGAVHACAGKVANQKGFPNAHFIFAGSFSPNGNGFKTPRFGLNGGIAINPTPGPFAEENSNGKSVVQEHINGSLVDLIDKCPDIP